MSVLASMFSHGSTGHLLGNMLFLAFVGPQVEKNFGFFKFSIFYVICGFFATLGFGLLYPEASVFGASGALSGVLAVYPFCQRNLYSILMSGSLIGYYFYTQFYNAMLQMQGAMYSSVAAIAHVAGGVAGLILLLFHHHTKNIRQ